jgi:hypothetical protein
MGNQWLTAPVVLIVSAKLSMLLGAVGCVGAWFEKKALLFLVSERVIPFNNPVSLSLSLFICSTSSQ